MPVLRKANLSISSVNITSSHTLPLLGHLAEDVPVPRDQRVIPKSRDRAG